MRAEGNDSPLLTNANKKVGKKKKNTVEDHNQIKFGSDVIVRSDKIVTSDDTDRESIGFLLFLY